ncbi:collagen alpha-1(I) chain-like [Peromyscus eremicus]|uniref:collagen alpha-1(I) chain-like n=1 Tax=Peromyscus eremicus TaxID=42410 RepID=UPI0027DE95AA|nr:collagen alpha-1(I) chain-like [Peromyscus eremicus]
MEEGGREERRDERPVFPAKRQTSTGAPAADTRNTRGSIAPPCAQPRRGGGPRRTSSRRTAGPDEPPDDTSAGGPTADGRRTTAKPLFPREAGTREGLPILNKRPAGSPKEHAALRPAAAGPRRPSNCSTRLTERLPDRGRPPGPVRARPPPEGGPAARPGRPAGENRRRAGRGNDTAERGPATAGATGTAPGRRLTRETERPLGRRTDTRGKPTGITPPHDTWGSPRHACGTDPARNRRPPGEPGKTQHGRLPTPPPPPKTLEREWAPTRPATRRGRPAVVPRRPHTPEREVDPAGPGSPAPRRGNRSPVVPNRGNAAGEGERGDSTTPQHERLRAHATHTACPRRGNGENGDAREGAARGGQARRTRRGGGDGWDPGSPPTTHSTPPPVPHPAATLQLNHENPPGSKHAGMTMALAPRDPSSDSERGGAGRGRPKEHGHTRVPPQETGMGGTPGQSYAHRAVGAGGRGGPCGREPQRDRKSTPLPRIAREETFLNEGGTDPARRASSCDRRERLACGRTRGGLRYRARPLGHPPGGDGGEYLTEYTPSKEGSNKNQAGPANARHQHQRTESLREKAAKVARWVARPRGKFPPSQKTGNTAEPLLPLSLLGVSRPPAFRGDTDPPTTNREQKHAPLLQPDRAQEARRGTGNDATTQKRAPLEGQPGTLQEHHEDRERGTRTHRSGRACDAADRSTPSPKSGEEGRANHTGQSEPRKGDRAPDASQEPHEPQREVRGSDRAQAG